MNFVKKVVAHMIKPDPRIDKLLAELALQKKAIDKFTIDYDPYENYFCTYKNGKCQSKGVLMWKKDKDLKIISANKAAENFGLGLAPDFKLIKKKEYKGKTTEKIFSHRDNGEMSQGDLSVISDNYVRETKKPARFFIFNARDNEEFLLDTHKVPIYNAEFHFLGIDCSGTNEIHRRKDIIDLLEFYLTSNMAERLDTGKTFKSALFVIKDRRQSQYDRTIGE